MTHPFPRIIKNSFIKPKLYECLRNEFPAPSLLDENGELYNNSPKFEFFLNNSIIWKNFYHWINSPEFFRLVFELFGPYLKKFNCKIDLEKANLINYSEPLAPKYTNCYNYWSLASLENNPNVNDLYIRFGIKEHLREYEKPIHCDLPHRLSIILIYFSNPDPQALDEGRLILHKYNNKYASLHKKDRHPNPAEMEVIDELSPHENFGVCFLATNNSYHSVTPLIKNKIPRRYIYISISSKYIN